VVLHNPTIPEAGHMVILEKPDEVAKAIETIA